MNDFYWQIALILVGHVIAWLAGAVHGYRTGWGRETEATDRRQKQRRGTDCVDCGAAIIGADDEAMVCLQCGGRNRRVGA